MRGANLWNPNCGTRLSAESYRTICNPNPTTGAARVTGTLLQDMFNPITMPQGRARHASKLPRPLLLCNWMAAGTAAPLPKALLAAVGYHVTEARYPTSVQPLPVRRMAASGPSLPHDNDDNSWKSCS